MCVCVAKKEKYGDEKKERYSTCHLVLSRMLNIISKLFLLAVHYNQVEKEEMRNRRRQRTKKKKKKSSKRKRMDFIKKMVVIMNNNL